MTECPTLKYFVATEVRDWISNQWKKEQVWPFFGCCTADSQTDAGRHQLYNNGLLVLFFHCLWISTADHIVLEQWIAYQRGRPRAMWCDWRTGGIVVASCWENSEIISQFCMNHHHCFSICLGFRCNIWRFGISLPIKLGDDVFGKTPADVFREDTF